MPVQTVIKLRRDIAADWESVDPILADGELGIETDTNRIKIGDGVTEWTGLSYGPVSDNLHIRVKNASGSVAIPAGTLVQFAGAAGDTVTAQPAVTDGSIDFHSLIGITSAEIAADGFGDVVLTGNVYGIATDTYTVGTLLYADPVNAGQLTDSAPAAPAFGEPVAAVVRSGAGTSGIILVRMQLGSSLNDIHDVTLSSPSSGQVLQFDGTKWVNGTIDLSAKQDVITGAASTITSSDLTADRAVISDGSGKIAVSSVTSTELGYVDGVTSSIQDQLNSKAPIVDPYFTNGIELRGDSLGTGITFYSSQGNVGSALLSGGNSNSSTPIYYQLPTAATVGFPDTPEQVRELALYGQAEPIAFYNVNTGENVPGKIPGRVNGTSLSIGYGAAGAYLGGFNYNIAFGHGAASFISHGFNSTQYCIAIGTNALASNGGAVGIIAIGRDALGSASGPNNNQIAIGNYASQFAGSFLNDSISIGTEAMQSARNSQRSIGIGRRALMNSGALGGLNQQPIGIGNEALENYVMLNSSTTSVYNVAIGHRALRNFTDGTSKTLGLGGVYGAVAIGPEAMGGATPTGAGIAIGAQALRQAGTQGVGYWGSGTNTAVGIQSLRATTTGNENTAMGHGALYRNTTGSGNVGIGVLALENITTGTINTAIGIRAGNNLTTGSNNTLIGRDAASSSATVSNEITLGNNQITNLRCNDTSISGLSDARDKKDVQAIEAGIDFINKLRPVKFTWEQRDGGRLDILDSGFIAQELMAVEDEYDANEWLHLTSRNNPDRYEAAPARLIPILVKAIQDLSAEIETLKEQLNG